jgi:methylaspartate ammonia-lyase
MEQKLLNALVAHYSARIQTAEANLLVHFKSPAGVGEHPDAVGNMVGLVDQVAAARSALQVLNDMVQTAQPEGEEGADPAPPTEG